MNYNRVGRITVLAMVALAALSCTNELTKSASPVTLTVTNVQDISRIDLAGGTGCDGEVGRITVSATLKNPDPVVDQQFNAVRISRYAVSYVRTDGGTAVPAPFVRSIDALIQPGAGGSDLNDFVVITGDAFRQAPFISLIPPNSGIDPETNRRVIRLDAIIDVFGETLAGTNVSARTRMPFDFCYDCNGCA
jgi:hypothetical protein